ncbi:hypothetical protein VVD49_10645 [Uliginosibacterium sp. H3]|uniref:Lipoprotein n=1 Tax=Uliginosibacterium silvisoli TaxID=3114758 RepID=A0ABU6K418_9RHOO|nr:hypothetical protein [Uliginosibacterium sp. H3]
MNSPMRLRRLSTLLALCAALLTLCACQKTEEPPAAVSTSTTQGTAPADDAKTLRFVDAAGTTQLTLNPSQMEARFGTGDQARTLRAESADGDKRKYVRTGEGVVMEVKAGDDGFKLRSRDSHLLWKLKLKDKGIKISDNEENARPVALKIKGNDIEISDNDKPLGTVSFDGDKSRAKITDATGKTVGTVQAHKISAAFALPLATRIPESERAVLALELLARGL